MEMLERKHGLFEEEALRISKMSIQDVYFGVTRNLLQTLLLSRCP